VLAEINRERDIAIGPGTIRTRWQGERMDFRSRSTRCSGRGSGCGPPNRGRFPDLDHTLEMGLLDIVI
jgi:hypothetical protein